VRNKLGLTVRSPVYRLLGLPLLLAVSPLLRLREINFAYVIDCVSSHPITEARLCVRLLETADPTEWSTNQRSDGPCRMKTLQPKSDGYSS
jgi:hypothetical protein